MTSPCTANEAVSEKKNTLDRDHTVREPRQYYDCLPAAQPATQMNSTLSHEQ